jgi:hypothetical protein
MHSFWTKTKHLLGPAYRLWIRFGDAIGWVNSRIILGGLFYLVIAPIGLLLRWLGKGRIREINQTDGASLRQPSHIRSNNHFERLF